MKMECVGHSDFQSQSNLDRIEYVFCYQFQNTRMPLSFANYSFFRPSKAMDRVSILSVFICFQN